MVVFCSIAASIAAGAGVWVGAARMARLRSSLERLEDSVERWLREASRDMVLSIMDFLLLKNSIITGCEMRITALRKRNGMQPAFERMEAGDSPADGFVRLAPLCVGVCRTDGAVAAGAVGVGPDGVTLFHEVAARIVCGGGLEAGAVASVFPRFADGGFMGLDRDGVFADFFDVPSSMVRVVPEGTDPRVAAYSEPVAAAMSVLDAGLSVDREVLVYGDNRIADLAAFVLESHGYSVLKGRPSSGRWSQVVETEATAASWSGMQSVMAPGAVMVLKSRGSTSLPFDVSRWVFNRWRAVGVDYADFQRAVEWASGHAAGLGRMFGGTHPRSCWMEALAESALERGKVFIDMGAD